MTQNVTNTSGQEKPEKWTGKLVGAGVGLVLGGVIGELLLGGGAILFAAVVCGIIGGALGAVFD
jgi:uncharacterized protein YcfJ